MRKASRKLSRWQGNIYHLSNYREKHRQAFLRRVVGSASNEQDVDFDALMIFSISSSVAGFNISRVLNNWCWGAYVRSWLGGIDSRMTCLIFSIFWTKKSLKAFSSSSVDPDGSLGMLFLWVSSFIIFGIFYYFSNFGTILFIIIKRFRILRNLLLFFVFRYYPFY